MKLINNQETRLFDEIKKQLVEGSEVFISASYFTVNAIFELAPELSRVKQIQILIDGDVAQDIRFAYDERECSQYLDLKGKFKAENAYYTVKDKCQIRYGNMGGQKFILIKNESITHCFSIAPHDLNLVSFGLLPSLHPVITTSFEDIGNQYLNLFGQFWGNSGRDIKDSVLGIIEKACINHKPEDIYKFNLYHIFQGATTDEASEQRLKKIGFKDTLIWAMLYNYLPVLLTLADDYQGSEFKKEDIMHRWQYLKIFKDPNVKMVMNMAGEDKIVTSTEAPNVDVLYRPVSIAVKDSDKNRIGELAHDLIDPPATQNLNFSKFGPALADGVFRNMALSELFSSYLTYSVLDNNANSSLLVKRFLNEKGITDHDLATAKMFIETRLLTAQEWSFFINHLISLAGKVGFELGDWSDYKNYQLKGLRFSFVINGFEKGSKFLPLLEQINPLSGNRIELEKNCRRIQAMFFLTNDKRRKLTDEQFSEKIKEKLDGYDFFMFDLTDFYNDFEVAIFDEELIIETMFDLEYDLTGLSPVSDSVNLIEAHTSTDPAFQTRVDNVNLEIQEQIKRTQHKRGLALEVKLARLEAQKLIAMDHKAVLNAVKLLFQSEQNRVVSAKIPEYLNYIESLLRLDHVTPVQMEKVLHVSGQIGDGLGYDILIPRMQDGQINVYRVEVKSATGNNHRIYISENERRSILGFIQEPYWRLWLNGESPVSLTEQVKEYVKKHNDQLTELKEKRELYLSADQWMLEFGSK